MDEKPMLIAPPSRRDRDRVDWRQLDADTAPVFSVDALLAAARRIEPDAITLALTGTR